MRILVGLDPSGASQYVLDEVAARPWPAASEFRALTVVEQPPPLVLAPVVETALRRAEFVTGCAAADLRSRGLQSDHLVHQGDPKAVILDQAKNWGANLIVLGAHAGGALETFLLGSVSRAVLRHAHCSVHLVRAAAASQAEDYTEMYRVLLPVDGSEESSAAAKMVAGVPWPAWTEVRVMSAVELELGFFRSAFEVPGIDPSHLEKPKEQAMLGAQEAIQKAQKILEPSGLRTSEALSVLLQPPKVSILKEAEDWGANLIVLGSHGRSAASRFLMGSTSEAVATHAKCSVCVVRRGG